MDFDLLFGEGDALFEQELSDFSPSVALELNDDSHLLVIVDNSIAIVHL
jgi:hypothetical protein